MSILPVALDCITPGSGCPKLGYDKPVSVPNLNSNRPSDDWRTLYV